MPERVLPRPALRDRILPVMKRLLAIGCAVALGAAVGAPSAGAGGVPTIKSFKLFGGKVKCVLVGGTSSGVTCLGQLNAGARPFPKPNCQGVGDPGGGLGLGRTGKAKGLCLSENPIVPPVPVLQFGKSRTVGGVTCRAVSAAIGVRCTNQSSHGFRMSPSGWARF
jgi:hypothetical protein